MRAQAAAGNLPADLTRICNHKKVAGLDRMLNREKLARDPKEDKSLRRLYRQLRAEWVAEKEGAQDAAE